MNCSVVRVLEPALSIDIFSNLAARRRDRGDFSLEGRLGRAWARVIKGTGIWRELINEVNASPVSRVPNMGAAAVQVKAPEEALRPPIADNERVLRRARP